MSRRRNEIPTDRFNVSLPRPVANQVKALAEAQRTSGPAAIAALVMSVIQSDPDDQDADEARILASAPYQRLMAETERLAEALTEARRRLAEHQRDFSDEMERAPRWALPLDRLLADADWWDRWLPKLYQLMGSDGPGLRQPPTHAGYIDLMELMFPAMDGVIWRSLQYPAAAASRTATSQHRDRVSGPGRALAWEPVIRHVARGLAALEATELPDADPYHGMRVQAEISAPWIDTLRHLLGDSPAGLRDLPLGVSL